MIGNSNFELCKKNVWNGFCIRTNVSFKPLQKLQKFKENHLQWSSFLSISLELYSKMHSTMSDFIGIFRTLKAQIVIPQITHATEGYFWKHFFSGFLQSICSLVFIANFKKIIHGRVRFWETTLKNALHRVWFYKIFGRYHEQIFFRTPRWCLPY